MFILMRWFLLDILPSKFLFKVWYLLRGRPFDSEGVGLVALFGNKYSDFENAGNK